MVTPSRTSSNNYLRQIKQKAFKILLKGFFMKIKPRLFFNDAFVNTKGFISNKVPVILSHIVINTLVLR